MVKSMWSKLPRNRKEIAGGQDYKGELKWGRGMSVKAEKEEV